MSTKKIHKAWALATAAAVVPFVAAVPAEAAAMPFIDIKNSGSEVELYKAVSELYSQGIVFGTTSTTFSPYQNLTRGEAAYFLAEALKLETKNVVNPGFSDVPTSHKYYGHIAALAEKGIIQKGTNYNPDHFMNRSQMAKILTIGFNLQQATTLSAPFSDFTKENETNMYIQTLLNYGITQGTSATTFSPYTDVRRGQMALFLYRTLQKTEDNFYIISVE
ncbi:S-layer homology domain-containing protein [Lysinibacillus sp. CNPSo 3705]|uniref:S-layer homology domain-containing protein n=1 Tax=Lysinibacillus sp. CNPSo 3705 TaxID=3028148 RepID=UPI00236498ED|nr:S-layer homology domain-containing protein [Lysinibacillus sp. CNPSo 3705]MDD1504933.1 S-layer homology domain-containing protein [Lysinibacillus sp. CNPSo 3705]